VLGGVKVELNMKLIELRKEAGLLLEAVASAVNISEEHYEAMERGFEIPTKEQLLQLALFLGSTLDYLEGKVSEKDCVVVSLDIEGKKAEFGCIVSPLHGSFTYGDMITNIDKILSKPDFSGREQIEFLRDHLAKLDPSGIAYTSPFAS
jgi:transcriptional regulator with XRE-family HTH domain